MEGVLKHQDITFSELSHGPGVVVGGSGETVSKMVGETSSEIVGVILSDAVGVTAVGVAEGLAFSLPQEERTIIKTVIIPTIPIRFICSTPFSFSYLLVA